VRQFDIPPAAYKRGAIRDLEYARDNPGRVYWVRVADSQEFRAAARVCGYPRVPKGIWGACAARRMPGGELMRHFVPLDACNLSEVDEAFAKRIYELPLPARLEDIVRPTKGRTHLAWECVQ
jgi:hypothetical protein